MNLSSRPTSILSLTLLTSCFVRGHAFVSESGATELTISVGLERYIVDDSKGPLSGRGRVGVALAGRRTREDSAKAQSEIGTGALFGLVAWRSVETSRDHASASGQAVHVDAEIFSSMLQLDRASLMGSYGLYFSDGTRRGLGFDLGAGPAIGVNGWDFGFVLQLHGDLWRILLLQVPGFIVF